VTKRLTVNISSEAAAQLFEVARKISWSQTETIRKSIQLWTTDLTNMLIIGDEVHWTSHDDLCDLIALTESLQLDPERSSADVEEQFRHSRFAGLARFVPRGSGALAGWLGVLLMILTFLLMLHPADSKSLTPEQVQQIIEQVVTKVEKDSQSTSVPAPSTTKRPAPAGTGDGSAPAEPHPQQ
jgi:hypothetical protein